jgi:hypothetical protein
MRISTSLILGISFLGANAAAGQNLLENGTFGSNLVGWSFSEPLPPETAIAWDAFGNPDGSLTISSGWETSPPAYAIAAESQCLTPDDLAYNPLSVGDDVFYLQLTGDVYSELDGSGDNCRLNIALYDQPDCSDSPAESPSGAAIYHAWEARSELAAITPTIAAFRVRLTLRKYPGVAESSCRYDNLALIGPPPPTLIIPTLQFVGLLALALTIASAALVALRLRKPSAR